MNNILTARELGIICIKFLDKEDLVKELKILQILQD